MVLCVVSESFDVVEVDNEVEANVEVRVEFEFIDVVVDDVDDVAGVVVVVDDVVRHGVVVEVVCVIVEEELLVVVDGVLQVHKDVSFKIVLICA